MYSQRIPTDWANRRCCGDARVVHEIPWSNDIITSNVGFLGDSVVEELGLINYTVFCRVGKNLGDVSIKIFFCHLIGNLAQLTLFPRVSKTSKANFGYRFAILREHFFKHRFFEDDELVILTLMKGDEGVKSGEEGTDSLLFGL